MAHEIFEDIDDLLSTREPFAMFVKVTWFRLVQVVQDFLAENDDFFISREKFISIVKKLYKNNICSPSHRSDLKALFKTNKLSNAHRFIVSCCLLLYAQCVHDLAACVIAQLECKATSFDVSTMPSERLANYATWEGGL